MPLMRRKCILRIATAIPLFASFIASGAEVEEQQRVVRAQPVSKDSPVKIIDGAKFQAFSDAIRGDLGDILLNETHLFVLRLVNDTKKAHLIERVESSCGCVVATLQETERPWKSGESRDIRFKVLKREIGKFDVSMNVWTNSGDAIQIRLNGRTRDVIEFTPRSLTVRKARSDYQVEIDVVTSEFKPILEKIKLLPNASALRLESVTQGAGSAILRLSTIDEEHASRTSTAGRLHFLVPDETGGSREVMLPFEIESRISVFPRRVVARFGSVESLKFYVRSSIGNQISKREAEDIQLLRRTDESGTVVIPSKLVDFSEVAGNAVRLAFEVDEMHLSRYGESSTIECRVDEERTAVFELVCPPKN